MELREWSRRSIESSRRWGISLRQLETDQCGGYLSISFMFLTITISSKCNAADDQIEAVTGEGEVDFDVALHLVENCITAEISTGLQELGVATVAVRQSSVAVSREETRRSGEQAGSSSTEQSRSRFSQSRAAVETRWSRTGGRDSCRRSSVVAAASRAVAGVKREGDAEAAELGISN
nr:hypothetical protein Itr_chr15CG15880 [Ipomoea trifida]